MNQQQSITKLKAKGYAAAFCTNKYTVLTRPVGSEHTGQVVFKNGEIQTLQSIDAVRAINNEEINMSKYYTEKMIDELTEKERTALYNERTGKTVARMRNKPKAVEAILATNPEIADSPQHEDAVAMEEQEAVKVSQRNTDPAPNEPADRVNLKATEQAYEWVGRSIKSKVRQVLEQELQSSIGAANPCAYTVEELCQITESTRSTVMTAISDLRSEKYAGDGGKLNIVKTQTPDSQPAYIIQS